MPDYLQKRRRLWYAIYEIPKDVRRQFKGKIRWVKSLGTDSRSVAARRVLPLVAMWRKEIEEARGNPSTDDAAYWRRALTRAKSDTEREAILEQVEAQAWDIGATHVAQIGMAPTSSPEAQEFMADVLDTPFCEHLDAYLAEANLALKTKADWRASIIYFSKSFATVSDVTKPAVRQWASRLIAEGRSIKTAHSYLSALRGYWRHLGVRGIVSEDLEPFNRLALARQSHKTAGKRLPFEPADIPKLIDAAGDSPLADVIRIAAYTGMRVQEICALKISDVGKGQLAVREGKTAASNRTVPIHPKLAPVIKRLRGASGKDGYLIPGLVADKHGNRSRDISRLFGLLKTKLGYGPEFVLHSIRKTVATQLENAGVSEGIAADILGHKKRTMTYGLYSGGASLKVKAAALAKLRYPTSCA